MDGLLRNTSDNNFEGPPLLTLPPTGVESLRSRWAYEVPGRGRKILKALRPTERCLHPAAGYPEALQTDECAQSKGDKVEVG